MSRCNQQAALVEIDTLWNVKMGTLPHLRRKNQVEIDTLWNVKAFAQFLSFDDENVEIDTLWNVKILSFYKETNPSR